MYFTKSLQQTHIKQIIATMPLSENASKNIIKKIKVNAPIMSNPTQVAKKRKHFLKNIFQIFYNLYYPCLQIYIESLKDQ
jgi:hypothetical protein